jgi:hypothetical protein
MYLGFEFRVCWHDEDVIELYVAAWNGAFGGGADIYEAIGDLRFAAERLRGFPNHPKDTREVVFGNFDRKCAGGGVRLRFHCIDGAGPAYVEAMIDSNYVSGGTVQTALLAMPVEAAAVDTFVRELEKLESDLMGTAYLKCRGVS